MWSSRSVNTSGGSGSSHELLKGSLQFSAAAISQATFPGQIRNFVKYEGNFNKLCKHKSSFLHKILYCQSGLSNNVTKGVIENLTGSTSLTSANVSASCGLNPKSIVNHEFVIIIMKIGSKKYCYLAEKCGTTGGDCGIVIKPVKNPDVFREAEVCTFECEDTPMPLKKVMRILEDHDPDYSVHEKNCWEYAVETTKRLLKACEYETGQTRFGEQAKLVASMVTVNHVKDMAARGCKVLLDMLSR